MATVGAQDAVPRIGWIGLGNMGLAMAKNLQAHLATTPSSPALCYTNRTLSRGVELEALGARPYASVAEVVKASDVIFISVSVDAVLESIVREILSAGDVSHKIVVDTSTVHPDTSVAVSTKLAAQEAMFVAAPVFGATPVAERGQLLFAVAGPDSAVSTISPFLQGVLARAVIQLGNDVSKASVLKTTGNFITAGMMELLSEAYVFAEKAGLPSHTLEALIQENYGVYAYGISTRLTTGAYIPPRDKKPTSDLDLAIKDVSHGITCAEAAGAKLDIAELALSHLQQAKQFSENDSARPLDSSSLYGIVRQQSGLDFKTDLVKKRDASG